MDRTLDHALKVLEEAYMWKTWDPKQHILASARTGKYSVDTPKFLYHCINESQKLGGTVLNQFWDQLSKCHPQLRQNVERLQHNPDSIPRAQATAFLFEGIDRSTVDFEPILNMAAEYLTHLGIAFTKNPDRPKSGGGTSESASVSDLVEMTTSAILRVIEEDGSGTRKQASLKLLASRRDGLRCPFTTQPFRMGDSYPDNAVFPVLARVVPHSIHSKTDTMNCIAMFAGPAVRELVQRNLDKVGNAINMEANAHESYDRLFWAIEAQRRNDGTIKYIYRKTPPKAEAGPGFIRLRDGDEINFGQGSEANTQNIGSGPLPELCNLQLAVLRVLKLSGAAELISQLWDDADDSDIPHIYLASDYFCDILTAKLTLHSGYAAVTL